MSTNDFTFIMKIQINILLLFIFLSTILWSQKNKVIYENNFNSIETLNIADDFINRNNMASIAYSDSILRIHSIGTGVVLLNKNLSTNNYSVEFDFTIEKAVNKTRWGGLIFKFNEGKGYWISAIRQNGNSAIGNFSFVSNSWSISNTFAQNGTLEPNKMYHIKTVVFNNRVSQYIDGIFVGSANLSPGYELGSIGFTCIQSTIKIDNLIVKSVDEKGEEPYLADIYKPDTKIANSPIVVSKLADSNDYNTLNNPIRPAVTIVEIDDFLNVLDMYGNPISTVSTMLADNGKKVIPAFFLRTETQSNRLALLLKSLNIVDAFVMTNVETSYLVKQAREICRTMRGIIQFNSEINNQQNASAIIDSLNINYANIAVLPITTKVELIMSIQSHLAMVWLNADKNNEIYTAIVKGANGIISNDFNKVYSIYSTFDTHTVIRKPLFCGHRGYASSYPENTLGGFKLAHDIQTDMIEMDVYLTTDNHIVVIHDGTVDRTTNGTGIVENLSLEQLKSLNIDYFPGIYEKISTLEEVFQFAKENNVLIQLDIKSEKPEIIPILAELIKKYDFYNQIIIFSFNNSQLALVRKLIPSISTGLLVSSFLNDENIVSFIMSLSQYNHQPGVDSGGISEYDKFIYTLSARGFGSWFWTVNYQSPFDKFAVIHNVTSLISDFPQWGNDFKYKLEAIPENPIVGTNFYPTALLTGSSTNIVSCKMIKIGGAVEINSIGNGYQFSTVGTDTVMYYKDLTFRSSKYRVYSEPVVLNSLNANSIFGNESNNRLPKVYTTGQMLLVKFPDSNDNAELNIYRVDGTKIYFDKLSNDFQKEISPGAYIVKLTINGQSYVHKVISQKN